MEYYIDMCARNKDKKKVTGFTDCIDEVQSLKEKLLKKALEKNPSVLEKGLKLVRGGRQFPTDVSNIHLLMLDKNRHYVVVELKKGKTEDGVVGQTLGYMGWVRENMSKTQPVRGIIVVAKGEITLKLKMAIIGLQHCQDLIQLKEIPIHIGDLKDHN